jgi:glycosyltransferase involved in cell wall biosynthesis
VTSAPKPPPGPVPGLSAFLIVKDEAARLGRTLAALHGLAEEVIVVDSGSRDATVAIAKAAGAKVLTRDFDGYGGQKRFAEDQCTGPWLLNVDADEVVTDALAAEIRAALIPGPAPAGFRIRILNVYPGDDRPRPFANDYEVVRLYHRDAGRYRDHPLFDRVETTGPLHRLRAPIHHFPFLTWHALIEKQNRYSTFQAETARHRSRAMLLARFWVEFPLVMAKGLIGRRHIFGGWKGVAFAAVIAFARFMRIAKMLASAEDARRD